MIVVFELPFVVDEEDITRFFAKTIGQVRRVHIIRTGALIFSSALIEFQKKSHVQKAIALAMQGLSFSGEFEVILQSAEDFLEGIWNTHTFLACKIVAAAYRPTLLD